MTSKRIGHVWFSALSTVGIVLCYDENSGQYKSWIAPVVGNNQRLDLEHIQRHGAKFPVGMAVMLVSDYGEIEDIKAFQAMITNQGKALWYKQEVDNTGPHNGGSSNPSEFEPPLTAL